MEKEENCQNRIGYLDILRIMSTIAVIMIHVVASEWYSADVNNSEWFVLVIYDGIVRWAVPIFVMISGVLFLEKGNKGIVQLYKKNIFKIVKVFLIWSLIYSLNSILKDNLSAKEWVVVFLKGPYHMWYLYMIVGLYILVPLLKEIVKNMMMTKYFLLLTLIFTFVLPYIAKIFLLTDSGIGMLIEEGMESINFHFTLGYVGYFVLGYYLNKINTGGKVKWLIYILGISGFVLTVLLTLQISWLRKIPDGTFYDSFSLNVMFESIAIFVFCKNNNHRFEKSYFKKEFVRRISQYTFGAYLSHVLVIEFVFFVMGQNKLFDCPLIYIPMITVIVTFISFGISILLNHIPIVRKYMV